MLFRSRDALKGEVECQKHQVQLYREAAEKWKQVAEMRHTTGPLQPLPAAAAAATAAVAAADVAQVRQRSASP